MTPYRTDPRDPDLDVARFAAQCRQARRARRTGALALLVSAGVACLFPLTVPARPDSAPVSDTSVRRAPFEPPGAPGPPARRLPFMRAHLVGPGTCMSLDPTRPPERRDLEIQWEREWTRLVNGIDCETIIIM